MRLGSQGADVASSVEIQQGWTIGMGIRGRDEMESRGRAVVIGMVLRGFGAEGYGCEWEFVLGAVLFDGGAGWSSPDEPSDDAGRERETLGLEVGESQPLSPVEGRVSMEGETGEQAEGCLSVREGGGLAHRCRSGLRCRRLLDGCTCYLTKDRDRDREPRPVFDGQVLG